MRFTRTLRFRLLLTGVLVSVAVSALLIGNGARLIEHSLLRQAERHIAQLEPLLVAALAAPLAERDYPALDSLLSESHTREDIKYLLLYDHRGTLIASAGWDRRPPPPADDSIAQTLHEARPCYDTETQIEIAGQPLGTLKYGVSLTLLVDAKTELLRQSLLIITAGGILAALLFWLLSYWLTRQLRRLTDASRQIVAGNYDIRLAPAGSAELTLVTQAFNRMAEAVQQRIADLSRANDELEQVNSRLAQVNGDLQLAKDAAETASQTKTRFLANMSHEIRTPMNGVIGMAQVLGNSELNARQRQMVDLLQQSATGLMDVINDILDISRIEAGKLHIASVPFELRELLQTIVHSVAVAAGRKQLTLRHEVEPDVPDWLIGDPTRLRQVLLNLLSNAVKFTLQGGVSLRVERIAQADGHVALRFAIADTGIGIEPSAQERIFQSFTQADDSTTRQYGGSGLGLTIVRELVDLMGGAISVESRPGEGATFYFTVRLAEAGAA